MKSLAGEFDVILNTVSADHDYNEYLKLLNKLRLLLNAICTSYNLRPLLVSFMSIGGIAETQES
jgi:uncharacterized zinc-type alcohol dehydrogenase-like protein